MAAVESRNKGVSTLQQGRQGVLLLRAYVLGPPKRGDQLAAVQASGPLAAEQCFTLSQALPGLGYH
jgi:hypothetical protein